jgi:hypothetical protein
MTSRTIISLLATVLLLSCKTHVPKVDNGVDNNQKFPYRIDLSENSEKPEEVTLSTIGKDLEFIALETTPISLMGEILRIEFTSDYIFITAYPSNGLLQFDRNGKFIRIVGSRGRGPGEYLQISGFCTDQKTEKIYICSCWSYCSILEYNFIGQYIRSIDLPLQIQGFLVYDTIGLVFQIADYSPSAAGIITGDKNYSFLDYNLIITDLECNPLFKLKRYFMRNSNAEFGQSAFYYFNNELHFQQFGVDTLYALKNYTHETYANYNLGKRKMDPNIIFTRSNSIELKSKLENDIWISSIQENQDYLFIKLNLGFTDRSKYYIFNKHNLKTTLIKEDQFKNDLDGIITFWPKYIYNDSILVDYVNAFTLIDAYRKESLINPTGKNKEYTDKLKEITNNLTETSNPVLVVLR